MTERSYGDLSSPEVRNELAAQAIVLPIGSVEQHGPRLPLTVDIDIATEIAREVARRTGSLLAPGINYAARSLPHCGGGADFAGTIYVRGGVFVDYLAGILQSYTSAGARSIVLINGHYENESFLFEAIEECRTAGKLDNTMVLAFSWWSVVDEELLRDLFGDNFPGWHAEHAGICETSLMMLLRPTTVRPIQVDNETPPLAGIYVHPVDSTKISDRGVLSRTTGSSSEIGRRLFDQICSRIVHFLSEPPGLLVRPW